MGVQNTFLAHPASTDLCITNVKLPVSQFQRALLKLCSSQPQGRQELRRAPWLPNGIALGVMGIKWDVEWDYVDVPYDVNTYMPQSLQSASELS